MILVLLAGILMAGGILAWILGKWSAAASRVISLTAVVADLCVVAMIWASFPLNPDQAWAVQYNAQWIPQFGISFHLAMDGLGLIMAGLTAFIGILAVASSWSEIKERPGFFYFNLLWNLAGIMGVFLAVDLFLFYFFWEVMLIPMYILISIWGHENRRYASFKFFIFTQAGGLLMFLAILGLYFIHGHNTGVYTFNYNELIGTVLTRGQSLWLMAGFLAAFLVKIPAVPLHNWLPDAHAEAPTAGSVVLAGLLLKTGAYGMLRFVLPLFKQSVFDLQYAGMILGVIGILYGAKLAFAQTDLKRLIAYTSVSHMGFVILGISANNEFALQGVVIQIVCHALSTGALFIVAGAIKERIHTRDMGSMGGFWQDAPRLSGSALFFALASLGLPGLGNFVAEFLVLAGAFQVNVWIAAAASLGLVASALYSLRIVQKVFHGSRGAGEAISDFRAFGSLAAGIIIAALLWIGLYPQPLLDTAKSSLDKIRNTGNRILNEVNISE